MSSAPSSRIVLAATLKDTCSSPRNRAKNAVNSVDTASLRESHALDLVSPSDAVVLRQRPDDHPESHRTHGSGPILQLTPLKHWLTATATMGLRRDSSALKRLEAR